MVDELRGYAVSAAATRQAPAGFEASFLVLDGDPSANFDSTGAIVMRIKEGRRLNVSPATPEDEDDD